MKTLKIYTDGACPGNQLEENFGGWGAILEYGSHMKEMFGGEPNTTNNRMEMTALLRAFEAINKKSQQVEVFSDSAYLVNCFVEKWHVAWRRNGWMTAGKTPVENRDLWEATLPYLEIHQIKFFKVKGHINLNSKKLDIGHLLDEFNRKNGVKFPLADFEHAVLMNNLADSLANKGAESAKDAATPQQAALPEA